eukprot:2161498-Pleurochrysis_carterae.AAC.1
MFGGCEGMRELVSQQFPTTACSSRDSACSSRNYHTVCRAALRLDETFEQLRCPAMLCTCYAALDCPSCLRPGGMLLALLGRRAGKPGGQGVAKGGGGRPARALGAHI